MMWRLLKGGSCLRPGTYINIDLIKEKLILVLTHESARRTDRLSIGLLLTGIFSDVFEYFQMYSNIFRCIRNSDWT